MLKKKQRSKLRVRFDPYQPLYFVAYTDNSDEAKLKIAEVKRSLLPFNVELKVKPITVGSPTTMPALFVQDKYFFSLLKHVRGYQLASFIAQYNKHVQKIQQEFINRNKGKFVILRRPLYDKDSYDYINRYHLLLPSEVRYGFLSFDTNRVGVPVTQYLVESLHRMGVDVAFHDSHTISHFRFYIGKISTGED